MFSLVRSAVIINGGDFYGPQTAPLYWGATDPASYVIPGIAAGGTAESSPGRRKLTSTPVSGSFTPTPVELLGGLFLMSGTPGAFTLTSPTAADLVAAMDFPFYLKTIDITIANGTNGTMTFSPGAGCDIFSSTNPITIASATTRTLTMVFKNTASGSEHVTFFG